MKRSVSKTAGGVNPRIHLPKDYPWQILSHIVSDLSGSLSSSELKLVHSSLRKRTDDSLVELAKAFGPQSIGLDGKQSADNVFARYQIASLLKKFRFPIGNDERRQTAKRKFLEAEVTCKAYNLHGCYALRWLEDETELAAFTHAVSFLKRLLGFDLPSRTVLTKWSRHGPGANLDTKQGRVSLYDKYLDYPYSCTQRALGEARLAIQDDERWLGALEDKYRRDNDIPRHLILDQETFWSNVLKVVPGNRIAFVPKNSQTDRSIAIEPCMNLYLQLGIDGYIRQRLKRWGVDLDSQEKNQELARLGSREWEDPECFITLDLAAASDSITTSVCRSLLPVAWYDHLMKLRSPVGELDGEMISYEKISSMGNGYTFALESAIFFALCYGAIKAQSGRFDSREIAVFGDDIVIRKQYYPLVNRMLELAGFSINRDKSFIEGPFRESCGADWYKGTPVRPVFLDQTPTSVMGLWCDINRIRRILSLRRWGWEFEVTSVMERWIPVHFRDIQGPVSDETFDSYLHTRLPTAPRHRKKGVYEFKCLVARPKHLKGREFHFRKLMHPLRGETLPDCPWRLPRFMSLRVSGAGSVFAITDPRSAIVSRSYSPAWEWQDEYNDRYPKGITFG